MLLESPLDVEVAEKHCRIGHVFFEGVKKLEVSLDYNSLRLSVVHMAKEAA